MLVNYCWCLHSKIEWFDRASRRVMTMNLNVQCTFSSVCWQPLWAARPLHCQVLATINVKHFRFFWCYSIRTPPHIFFSIQTLSDNSTRGMGQQWFGSTTNCWPRNRTGWIKKRNLLFLSRSSSVSILYDHWIIDRPDAVFPAHQDSGWISSFSLMSNILDNPTK